MFFSGHIWIKRAYCLSSSLKTDFYNCTNPLWLMVEILCYFRKVHLSNFKTNMTGGGGFVLILSYEVALNLHLTSYCINKKICSRDGIQV